MTFDLDIWHRGSYSCTILVSDAELAGDVSHKPGVRLPLLSARPAVTPQPLRGLLGGQRHDG